MTWTDNEIDKVIRKTVEYFTTMYYDKMEYGDVCSLNLFVMLLNENFKEKQLEKENE